MTLRGWLLANLFLLSIALVGAGYVFAFGAAVKALDLGTDLEPSVLGLSFAAALFATYYTMKRLHGLIERLVNRRAR